MNNEINIKIKSRSGFTISCKSALNGLGFKAPANRSRLKHGILCGFTLVEVLVTLVLIGIVSTLTIPRMVSSTQNNVCKNSFKKVYTSIGQIVYTMQLNSNGKIWKNSSTDSNINSNEMRNEFKKYLKYTTEGQAGTIFASAYKKYKSTTAGPSFTSDTQPAIVLSDGSFIRFYSFQDCASGICGNIWVDTNGIQPPNMLGQDLNYINLIRFTEGGYGVKAYGDGDGNTCTIGTGEGCAYSLLYNKTMP